jgi:hypothetical protein
MDETKSPQPLFEESQDPPWPFLALGVGAPALSILTAARALGMALRFGVAGLAASGVGLALREFVFPLQTSLLPEELQVRFGRRTRFRIPLRNVVRAWARSYEPLSEFGGWGIRTGSGGRAFNMRGKEGVQLVLRSGQRVLVGSQRAEELAAAVRELTGCEGAPDETAEVIEIVESEPLRPGGWAPAEEPEEQPEREETVE